MFNKLSVEFTGTAHAASRTISSVVRGVKAVSQWMTLATMTMMI